MSGEDSGQLESLHGPPGDPGDEVEVLVCGQHREASLLRCRRDEQVRYRGRAMLAPISEEHLHLEGPVLHRRREMLQRHQRERWTPKRFAASFTRPGRETELEPRHRRKPHQTAFDVRFPLGNVRRLSTLLSHVGRLADQSHLTAMPHQ